MTLKTIADAVMTGLNKITSAFLPSDNQRCERRACCDRVQIPGQPKQPGTRHLVQRRLQDCHWRRTKPQSGLVTNSFSPLFVPLDKGKANFDRVQMMSLLLTAKWCIQDEVVPKRESKLKFHMDLTPNFCCVLCAFCPL